MCLVNGRIVKSGTKELALELEEKGYDFIKDEISLTAALISCFQNKKMETINIDYLGEKFNQLQTSNP